MIKMKIFTLIILLWTVTTNLLGETKYKVDRYDIPYKEEKSLSVNIDYTFGTLNIRPGRDNSYIMRAGVTYKEDKNKPTLEYKNHGNKGRLTLKSIQETYNKSLFNIKKNDDNDYVNNNWQLSFNNTIPISFDIEFGLGDGNIDLTGMKVEDIKLELGMSDVDVYFNKKNEEELRKFSIETGLGSFDASGLGNANISNLSVECGLGSATLSFDGEFHGICKGTVAVGLGSVDVNLPKTLAAEIRTESSFLSSVNLSNFDEIDDDLYRSKNWDTATGGKLYLKIEVGMGSAQVRWIK